MAAPNRLPGLDTLRALAILMVMLYHLQFLLPESLGPAAQFGWMGVDLFFVLSGYLIGLQLLKPYARGERTSIADFYWRRFLRIIPAYLAVLFLYAEVPAWRESPGLAPLWKFLTFTENFRVNMSTHAFSHAWSLCVEEHFYLILPLLVVWLMRRASARNAALLIAAVMLAGIALRAYAITHLVEGDYWPRIYYPTYMRLDGLLIGVTLAIIQVFRPIWWTRIAERGHATLLIAIALVASVMWMFRDDGMGSTTGPAAWGTVIGFPLLAIGLGLLVASSVSANGLLSRTRIPGAKLVATLAFSLYLTHKAIAHLDQLAFPTLMAARNLATMLTTATTCLAAAAILHYTVERPFLKLRDRKGQPTPTYLEEEIREDPAL